VLLCVLCCLFVVFVFVLMSCVRILCAYRVCSVKVIFFALFIACGLLLVGFRCYLSCMCMMLVSVSCVVCLCVLLQVICASLL